MSELSNKEKRFKEVLEDISFDLDTSALWDDIKDDLPLNKKKKSRPIWFLFFGFLFTACIPALLLYSFSTTSSSTQVDIIPFNSISSIDLNNTQNTSALTQNNKELLESKDLEQSTHQDQSTDLVQSTVTEIENSNSYHDALVNQEAPRSSKQIRKNNQTKRAKSNNLKSQASDIKSTRIKDVANNLELIDATPLAGPSLLDETTTNNFSTVSFLALNTVVTSIDNNLVRRFDNPLSQVMIEPIEERSKMLSTFILMRSGVNKSMVNNSLVSSSTDFNAELFQSEKALLGQNHFLGIGLENTKGWTMNFGLGYNTFNSSFNRSRKTQNIEEEAGTVQTVIDRSGNATETQGSIKTTETTFHNINWHRRHKTYNLQLSLAKEIIAYRNFSLSAEMAVSYSLSAEHSGYYFEENSETIKRFSSGESSPYKSKYGIAIQPGININYNINRVGVGLHTFYARPLGSITADNSFYKSNNALLGMQLQLAYRL